MEAKLIFASMLYGVGFWETNIIHEGKTYRRDISLKQMKKLGVAKTLNSSRKVEAWLNETEEGQAYLKEKVESK